MKYAKIVWSSGSRRISAEEAADTGEKDCRCLAHMRAAGDSTPRQSECSGSLRARQPQSEMPELD
jgi:hypothetical protein